MVNIFFFFKELSYEFFLKKKKVYVERERESERNMYGKICEVI